MKDIIITDAAKNMLSELPVDSKICVVYGHKLKDTSKWYCGKTTKSDPRKRWRKKW